jgi:hypothetical protein
MRTAAWEFSIRVRHSVSRVEVGSNTSTVALLVVGGDEKESLRSETVKYCRESQETRTSSNCKRHTRPLVREGAPHQQTRNYLTVVKNLVVSPRWVRYSKTDWPTDRRSSYKTGLDSI